MELPTDKTVFEDDLAFYWMDKTVLCSIVKSVPRTEDMVMKSFNLLSKLTLGQKVCLLSDTSLAGPNLAGASEVSAKLINRHFKAMALISYGPYGKILVNSFIAASGQPIPMHLFSSETDARLWLGRYA